VCVPLCIARKSACAQNCTERMLPALMPVVDASQLSPQERGRDQGSLSNSVNFVNMHTGQPGDTAGPNATVHELGLFAEIKAHGKEGKKRRKQVSVDVHRQD